MPTPTFRSQRQVSADAAAPSQCRRASRNRAPPFEKDLLTDSDRTIDARPPAPSEGVEHDPRSDIHRFDHGASSCPRHYRDWHHSAVATRALDSTNRRTR
jgi:hypothetical protein